MSRFQYLMLTCTLRSGTKTCLLFTIRDYQGKTPFSNLVSNITEYVEEIWGDIVKVFCDCCRILLLYPNKILSHRSVPMPRSVTSLISNSSGSPIRSMLAMASLAQLRISLRGRRFLIPSMR